MHWRPKREDALRVFAHTERRPNFISTCNTVEHYIGSKLQTAGNGPSVPGFPWSFVPISTALHTLKDVIPDVLGERFPGFPTEAMDAVGS